MLLVSRSLLLAIAICILSAFVNSQNVSASIVYSTFGEPGQTYKPTEGWGLGNGGGAALPFTPNDTFTLDSVSFAAFAYLGPSPVTVSIAKGDMASLKTLESFEVSLPTAPWAPQVFTVNSLLHPILEQGSTYWYVITADDRIKSLICLNMNDQNIEGDFYYEYDNAWHLYSGPLDAFSIKGTPNSGSSVPVPSSILLLCSGVIGLVSLRVRGCHKKFRA